MRKLSMINRYHQFDLKFDANKAYFWLNSVGSQVGGKLEMKSCITVFIMTLNSKVQN